MPGFAGLPVLCHCLAKTNGLQLDSHGCTLWSGAGETVSSFSHISRSKRMRFQEGCFGTAQRSPSFSPPTEAVSDPGDNSSGFRCLNSHLHLLTGHRMGLWYDPALGGFSPPNSAAQQWPIHPIAPTTRINVVFWQCKRGQAAFSGFLCLFCPCAHFFPGQFSGPHYFEAFTYGLKLFLSLIIPASWKHMFTNDPVIN